MKTMERTVQLPEEAAQLLEIYAEEHATSVPDLLTRFARRLQPRAPHPDNLKFTGTVPADIGARAEHRRHLERKHR